jgi:sugar lactone lactonase YvrE
MRTRFALLIAAVAATLVATVTPALGAKKAQTFPGLIQLPTGFQPEGIEAGKGSTIYVGSVANGAIWRGNVRTGKGSVFVPGAAGRNVTGMEFDKRKQRLFAAGASTGKAYVFSTRNGALQRTYQLGTAPTFINDVALTRNAAYFTDSQKPVIYKVPIKRGGRLGKAQTIQLGGDYSHVDGDFNLNGIAATQNGKTLIAVQSANGRLYRINPATGAADTIELANGESVPNGDGILLDGKTLYVVQNSANAIAVVALSPDLGAGTVSSRLTNANFDIPTTMDKFGDRLYAVNARFNTATPDPASATYQVVQLQKPTG